MRAWDEPQQEAATSHVCPRTDIANTHARIAGCMERGDRALKNREASGAMFPCGLIARANEVLSRRHPIVTRRHPMRRRTTRDEEMGDSSSSSLHHPSCLERSNRGEIPTKEGGLATT
jgi:hypothetical protein